MLPLLLSFLLWDTADEAKAKAILTLAAAAAQAKPAPDVLFFERLEVMPSEVRPDPAKPACACKPCHCADCACAGSPCSCSGCGLSAANAVSEAVRANRPVLVWIGHRDPALKARLSGFAHVEVAEYAGERGPGIAVGVPSGGVMEWKQTPWGWVVPPRRATEQAIRQTLAPAVSTTLRTFAPAMRGGC